MKSTTPSRRTLFSMRNLRIALVVLGIIIVLFNDTFGKLEGFIEFLLLYAIAVLVAVSHWLFVNIRGIINLKNEKAKTELKLLQAQVNPHFFFNMLNNLYGLVDRDQDKAKTLILKLSDMMRYSIYEGQKTEVSLLEEIEFLEQYIALHQMRYHKEITIDFKVDIADGSLKIAPLLFIILVENAFKHGVEKLRADAYVHLTMRSDADGIRFEISNNFDPEEQGPPGIGLPNLKRRLELIYPKRHQLEFEKGATTYTATLLINPAP
ncbi:histidine kinase [Flagellimonas sp. DF-77]|uniref:sensor histidine kinase n=1 Tax=Flagellimonas algarum TaxID=3230298 RepID=UPI0033926E94